MIDTVLLMPGVCVVGVGGGGVGVCGVVFWVL